jgi:restriction system protein
MLGKKSVFADACLTGNFIGTDFGIKTDLTHKLTDEWRAFNRDFVPVYLQGHPEKTRVAAGLACGAIWTVSKGIKIGDIAICPDGTGRYRVAEITDDYKYAPEGPLPHRRPVRWLNVALNRAEMSEPLQRSTGSIGTVSDISRHRDEIEKLLGGIPPASLVSTDPTVEDPASFALETHLEEFLVQNWTQTEIGKQFDIYEEEGEQVGQQYSTDTGPLDILAISKEKNALLVVELKKGRASDVVVGQILRYMSYVKEELAEDNQAVKGAIIALEDDPKIRRALTMVPNIDFYRYQISFKLLKS